MVILYRSTLTVVFAVVVALLSTFVESQDYGICMDQFTQSCNEANTTAGFTKCCSWINQDYSTGRSCFCYVFSTVGKVNNSMELRLLHACGVDTTGVGTVCPPAPPSGSVGYPPPSSTPTSAPSATPPAPYSTPISAPPPTTTSTAPPPPETPDTPPPPYYDSPPAPPDHSSISPTSLGSEQNGPAPAPPEIPKTKRPVLSTAVIAGIAAGGGALLLIVVGVLLFIILRRRRQVRASQSQRVVSQNPNIQKPSLQVPPYAYQPPPQPQVYQPGPPPAPAPVYPPRPPVQPQVYYEHQNVIPPQPSAREIGSHPQFEPVLPQRRHEVDNVRWNSNLSPNQNPNLQPPPVLPNLSPNPNRQPPPVLPAAKADSSKSTITYEELSQATNGFSEENLLGEGRLGNVYRGKKLDDDRDVAIKKLNKDALRRISDKQLQKEIEKISRISHKNLVALVGYCITSEEKLLVYDFVPNNTLEFHLHDEEQQILSWSTRMNIALGSARGLAYLHEDCRQTIIHGDIKSSNILLDDNLEPQIADFGLNKFFFDGRNHGVMGTFGYMAPEYASKGKLTSKSDVFSFGVVILELITGLQPAADSGPFADRSMVEWATPLMKYAVQTDDYSTVADEGLEKRYDRQQMKWMVACALACLRSKADLRPKMSEVLRTLEGQMSMDKLNHGVEPGQSMVFRPSDVSDIEAMRKKTGRRKSRASKPTTSEQYSSSDEFN